jgi:hypothetical protein
MQEIDWGKKNILKIDNEPQCEDEFEETALNNFRGKVEPWLSAIFQSEHLSLLLGSGLTNAVSELAGTSSQGMGRLDFTQYKNEIKNAADSQAKEMGRDKANMEDDLRVAIELYKGLLIKGDKTALQLRTEIDEQLLSFIKNVLKTEKDFFEKKNESNALNYLKSFLISFSSRTASRDRLQLFTTNYDRFIEYACDEAGILVLDRFIGKINPIFRTNKLELDYHYNPPGIRGEPRYVEGVVKYTKLHGSLDWSFENENILKVPLPFGAAESHPSIPEKPFDSVVVYPNSTKGIETVFYPYSELFRDFSGAVCRPNSVVVTYGYSFGDSHINHVLKNMLSVPSTHLVIIARSVNERIKNFVEENNQSQFTLLIGPAFGTFKSLVDNYLPKAAIDRISSRKQKILEDRGKGHTNYQKEETPPSF